MYYRLRTLGLSLILGTCNVISAYAGDIFEKDGIWYETSSNENAVVVAPESGTYIGDIVIPDYVSNGESTYKVTTIGSKAFWYCTELTSIELPSTLFSIEQAAFFGCSGLTSVILPEGTNRVKLDVFCRCSQLKQVVIPSTVTSVEATTFSACPNLESLIFCGSYGPNILQSLFNTIFTEEECERITLYVPQGKKSHYTDSPYNQQKVWNSFKHIVEYSKLEDGKVYTQSSDTTKNVLYLRSFNNTVWQPLYVPFALSVDTLNALGLKVATFVEEQQKNNGENSQSDETQMEFLLLTSGHIKPNWPCLIKSEKESKHAILLKDVECMTAEEKSIEFTSGNQRFTIVGTYTGVPGQEMYDNGYYGMAGGSLKRVSSENVALRPQRWYLKVENLDGSVVEAASIRFVVNESSETETTAISNVTESAADDALYTLSGLRVSAESVKPGLYVRNGKTVFIR